MKKRWFGLLAVLVLLFSNLTAVFAAESVDRAPMQKLKEADLPTQENKTRFADKIDLDELMKQNDPLSVKRYAAEEDMPLYYEVEPNDDPTSADHFQLDAAMYGTFHKGDIDFFKINIQQQSHVALAAGPLYEDALMEIMTGLFSSEGNIIEPLDYYSENGFIMFLYDLQPGTYYIAAVDYYDFGYDEPYLLFTLTLDLTPPASPKVNPIDDNDTLIRGKSEPDSIITAKVGNRLLGKPKTDKSGNFQLKVSPLKAGSKVTFIAEDESGKASKAATVTVTDKTPPAAPKVKKVDDNDKKVYGKAEPGSTVTVKRGTKILGKPKADKAGNFNLSITPIKAGTKLSFNATDAAKNVSKTATVTVLDKTAPKSLTVNKVTSKSSYVSGKTEKYATVKIKKGKTTIGSGKADSKGKFKIKIKKQKKNTSLKVIVSDKAKNTKSKTIKVK